MSSSDDNNAAEKKLEELAISKREETEISDNSYPSEEIGGLIPENDILSADGSSDFEQLYKLSSEGDADGAKFRDASPKSHVFLVYLPCRVEMGFNLKRLEEINEEHPELRQMINEFKKWSNPHSDETGMGNDYNLLNDFFRKRKKNCSISQR